MSLVKTMMLSGSYPNQTLNSDGQNLKLNITGGTFYNCNPTGHVATGYKVTSAESVNDIIYTVVAE